MAEKSVFISQRVDNYLKYRPHYPQAVPDLLTAECHLTTKHFVADIGSGTGILAKLFLQNGNVVFGVEPDPDMRAGAKYYLRHYPNFTSIAASAEVTTLPDQSVDFVTAGQSFHWFNLTQTRKEFERILSPGGWVCLVWNIQKSSGTPFLAALQKFWETPAFWKQTSQKSARQEKQAQGYRLSFETSKKELIDPFFGQGMYQEETFENPMICDFERLKGRILSNAPALEPDDANYDRMLAALASIFQTHQTDGFVTIEHKTHLIYGQLKT